MQVLGLEASALKVSSTTPQKENQQRLDRFRAFYNATGPDGSGQLLRQAPLGVHLTLHATSISSQTTTHHPERLLTLVRLGKAEVQRKTSEQLRDTLSRISDDQQLDVSRTVHRLLLTEAALIMRFRIYLDYPTKLWEITRSWKPRGYASCIEDFLLVPRHRLDEGYSAGLQNDAFTIGGEPGITPKAIAYLMSKAVQDEVGGILEADATSLSVERKNNLDKRGEGRKSQKVRGISRVSRDSILQRYRLKWIPSILAAEASRAKFMKAKFTNIKSLAIKHCPSLFSRGRGRLRHVPGEENVTEEETRQLTTRGDEAVLQTYIARHKQELEEELRTLKEGAKSMQYRNLPIQTWSGCLG